jgi:hypothetical protein
MEIPSMKANKTAVAAAMIVFFGYGSADAQEPSAADNAADTLDLTMTLMPEGATLPDAVTRIIELPAVAAEAAQENAASIDTANEARISRESGRGIAADAREQGAELGQQVREQAQENRENAERGRPDSAGPHDRPGGPPDVPGPPDRPGGPPDVPGPPSE